MPDTPHKEPVKNQFFFSYSALIFFHADQRKMEDRLAWFLMRKIGYKKPVKRKDFACQKKPKKKPEKSDLGHEFLTPC